MDRLNFSRFGWLNFSCYSFYSAWAKDVYQAAKGLGCSQWTFNGLSLQDFIETGAIAAHCHLKRLSLAWYYATQM